MGATYTLSGFSVLLQRRETVYAGNSLWEAWRAFRLARRLNYKYLCVEWRP